MSATQRVCLLLASLVLGACIDHGPEPQEAPADAARAARALMPELRRDLEALVRIPSVSVPGVIGRWKSANWASIVTRGSTTISGNLRFSSASFKRQ